MSREGLPGQKQLEIRKHKTDGEKASQILKNNRNAEDAYKVTVSLWGSSRWPKCEKPKGRGKREVGPVKVYPPIHLAVLP